MPEAEYVWLPRHDILQFEEMSTLVDVFARAGVDRVRLTGGEPLLRRDLPELIRMIARKPAIRDLALTTNGVMLADHARPLHRAGLHRLTVSLDTLRADRFQALTRFDSLAAGACRHRRGGELLRGHQARCGDHARHERRRARSAARVREAHRRRDSLHRIHGRRRRHAVVARARDVAAGHADGARPASTARSPPLVEDTSAPADRFRLPDGTVFGIISSTTEPFCSSCDRSRLTADGMWYRCLYATNGTDLRTPLRAGASPDDLLGVITTGMDAREPIAEPRSDSRCAIARRSSPHQA